jgi:dipeptidyl aminopeptidase/acylaminoacyl peptidase
LPGRFVAVCREFSQLGLLLVLGLSCAGQGMPPVRPVTVADAIQTTQVATDEGSPLGHVAVFSPDRTHFVVTVSKGNIEHNVVEYSLLLYDVGSVFGHPKPETLVSMASSSNRQGISHVKWLSDNETVLFLGEKPGESSQVYSANIKTRDLRRLTHHSTAVVGYDVGAGGQVIVFEAAPSTGNTLNTREAGRNGVVVRDQYPSDLMATACTANDSQKINRELFVQATGKPELTIPVTEFLTEALPLVISPRGDYAILAAYVRTIPAVWSDYQDPLLHPYIVETRRPGAVSNVQQYMLLDIRQHAVLPVLEAPKGWQSGGAVWSDDGSRVVLSGTYLPLDVPDTREREVRERNRFVVEVQVPSRTFTKVTNEDLEVLWWDHAAGELVLTSDSSDKNGNLQTYKKIGQLWEKSTTLEGQARHEPIILTIEQGINTPPKLFASDPASHRRALLLDLNPQFRELAFGKVETIKWRASDDHEVAGGLYLPPDFKPGQRYPLVIQTHGFQEDQFWIDGPWPSAFAAQPLAGKGIVVLQVGRSSDRAEDLKYVNTPNEAPRQMAAYEGAIDYLDRRGLIDRSRVGIIGFSRTVFHVEYALTHSRYHFAAATLADGFDGGYVGYLLWGGADFVGVNGGPPFGATLASWLKNSPGFQIENVTAPVRLEYYGPTGILGAWQWFSALKLLNKPVDFVWLPRGDHLLVRPWDRRVSLQGNVDWFVYWLKGERDNDPDKAEQYDRWNQLRDPAPLSTKQPGSGN